MLGTPSMGANFAQRRAGSGFVSNKKQSITSSQKGGSALDQFLPERMFAIHTQNTGATAIDPAEVHLEPLGSRDSATEPTAPPRVMPASAQVQAWPMVAAAMVAIGVSLLAFVAFAKFGLP